MRRICFVVSSPMTVEAFLVDHIRTLGRTNEVHLVTNADPAALAHLDLSGATLHRARIARSIAPLSDFCGVLELIGIFRRGRYAAVHSVTPKAGLLTALAAFAARVPVRIHTYTGQVWATRRGLGRTLLRALDTLTARLDTHLLTDSASQLDFLRAQRVLRPDEGEVIGNGSMCGVDSRRFRPDPAKRSAVRAELSIPEDAILFLFAGRLARDKGILELAAAFREVARDRGDAYLLMVGPDEESLAAEVAQTCGPDARRVRFAGHSPEPERFMAAGDVFCLASHREGFGAVIIEAAAAGLPAIGSRIYGIVDAIEEDRTGLLVPARDAAALAAAMRRLAGDEALRRTLGAAARERALEFFSTEGATHAMERFYHRSIASG